MYFAASVPLVTAPLKRDGSKPIFGSFARADREGEEVLDNMMSFFPIEESSATHFDAPASGFFSVMHHTILIENERVVQRSDIAEGVM